MKDNWWLLLPSNVSCQSYSIRDCTVNSSVTYSLSLLNFSITNASGTKRCSSSSIQHMIHYPHPLPLSNYIPLNTTVNSTRQKAPRKSIYVSMYVYIWSIINLKDLWRCFLYTRFNGSLLLVTNSNLWHLSLVHRKVFSHSALTIALTSFFMTQCTLTNDVTA